MKVQVNRAPVLTLWAATVAERLGYDPETALTLGKALAGLNAQSKGQRLGIFPGAGAKISKAGHAPGESAAGPSAKEVVLMGRHIPVARSREGVRALAKDQPIDPRSVEKYLEQKFGDALDDARAAMRALAKQHSPETLAEVAFGLYENFRPEIPEGQRGWGAKGTLDLDALRALATRARAH